MAKNWKIRKDLSIEVCGHKLFRIECTQDFKEIKAGTLGGYIEKEENLTGNAWVGDEARVGGSARVFGSACVCDEARVGDEAWVGGSACVCDSARVFGSARVYGDEIKNRYDICYISNRYYNITITPLHIKIGCQYHAQEAWWNFTDEQIEKMDGDAALSFWKIWKEPLKQICETMKKEKGYENGKC